MDIFAVESPFVVELTDLPAGTNQTDLKRMLSRQLGGSSKHFAGFSEFKTGNSQESTKKQSRL